MDAFRVTFYKKLTNSYGKPFNVCQRSIDIRRARSPERAVAAAKFWFERRELVPKWFLHADYVEIDVLQVAVPAVSGQEVAGTRRPTRRSKSRPVKIEASKKIAFRPAKELKEAV